MVSFTQGHLGTAGIKRHQLGVKKKKTEKKNFNRPWIQGVTFEAGMQSGGWFGRSLRKEENSEEYVAYVLLIERHWVSFHRLTKRKPKKSEAEVSPAPLIWSSPLRTLPRMYADSTLWWAECAFSLLKKEHTGQIRKKLVCSSHRWSIKALCRH